MPLYWEQGQVKFLTIGFELEFDSTFRKTKPKIIELLKNGKYQDLKEENTYLF